jgi:hypothetical protein
MGPDSSQSIASAPCLVTSIVGCTGMVSVYLWMCRHRAWAVNGKMVST